MSVSKKSVLACLFVVLGACAPVEYDEAEDLMDQDPMTMAEPSEADPAAKIDKAAMWQLNVFRSGTGTVIGTNLDDNRRVIDCGTDCSESFVPFFDQNVSLMATPAAGWRFAYWGGSCAGASPTCTVPVRLAGADVTAYFERDPVVTVQVRETNSSATMSITPQGATSPTVSCSSTSAGVRTCAGSFRRGTQVTVEIYSGQLDRSSCPTQVVLTPITKNGAFSGYVRSTCTFTVGNDVTVTGYGRIGR